MEEVYSAADLSLRERRASLAEFAGFFVARHPIPFPYAADDHKRAMQKSMLAPIAAIL